MKNNNSSAQKSVLKKTLDVISTILIFVYIIAVVIIAASVFTSMETGQPSVFGYTLLYVQTDSMEGNNEDSLFTNDLVICKEYDDYSNVEVGAIIAYNETQQNHDEEGNPIGEEYIIVKIHRVVGKDGDYFITKGDNVEETDPIPVSPTRVLGVYTGTRIPLIGKIFNFFQSSNGILVCMVIPMALFFIWALYKFVKAMIEFKMSKAIPADGELTEEQKQAAIAEYLAKQAAEANKDENNTDN